MADRATPNLPSRTFDGTSAFYGALGFTEAWRNKGWMILTRGEAQLEFFPNPDLDPFASSFGACLRLDDLDSFYAVCKGAGIAEKSSDIPRIQPPVLQAWGSRMGYLLDLDGSLIALIQNEEL